ncbi:MAG: bifunctional DNA primase/polymerase [Planctomycetes bacterium]|nr:bifunctional DNA primase/polymerase [Planctomycetota bacterium]
MILNEAAPTAEVALGEALILRGWGWCPFPVDSNKRPLVRWKRMQRRRPTDRELASMFRIRGVAGVAVVTGSASGGLVNRDFDIESSYDRWAAEHPRLARVAPTVRTARGFRVCIRSRVSIYRQFDDGEVIGDNKHFAVMPPSRHPSGVNYTWVNGPPLGLSEFPLLDLVAAGFLPSYDQPSKRSKASLAPTPVSIPDFEPATLPDAIREAILRTLPHRAGERNHKLFMFARSLRDHIPEDAPPGLLFDSVRTWWQMALPVIETKEFGVTLADFRRSWSTCAVPMCQSRPKRVMACAASAAMTPREKLEAACRALAAETGGAFHMSVRTAGNVAGIPSRTAARLLTSLVTAGFLEIVQRASPSATKRMATEYRLKSFASV